MAGLNLGKNIAKRYPSTEQAESSSKEEPAVDSVVVVHHIVEHIPYPNWKHIVFGIIINAIVSINVALLTLAAWCWIVTR